VQFAQDATFCPEAGNSGEGYSFESVNFPNDYIRHFDYTAYIASGSGTPWTEDTSFLIASPW